jgi:hypothetical protein
MFAALEEQGRALLDRISLVRNPAGLASTPSEIYAAFRHHDTNYLHDPMPGLRSCASNIARAEIGAAHHKLLMWCHHRVSGVDGRAAYPFVDASASRVTRITY